MPHHLVCVEKFTLPYLTLHSTRAESERHAPRSRRTPRGLRVYTLGRARALASSPLPAARSAFSARALFCAPSFAAGCAIYEVTRCRHSFIGPRTSRWQALRAESSWRGRSHRAESRTSRAFTREGRPTEGQSCCRRRSRFLCSRGPLAAPWPFQRGLPTVSRGGLASLCRQGVDTLAPSDLTESPKSALRPVQVFR